jgi:hypothetical protein
MKKLNVIFSLLFIAIFAMGAKIGDDTVRIGTKTGQDIEVQMGEGRLKWDASSSKMQFSNDSGGSLKDIGSGAGGAAGVNLLENADFESGNPPVSWTESAGTFIAETSNPGFGNQSGSWDSAAASNTLDSDAKAVELGLENRSCNATIQYKYASGSNGDYKFQVIGTTAGLIAEKELNVTTDWRKEALQFTCPSSDSLKIRITSTVNGGIVLLDNATLGRTDFVDISQSELVAHAYYAPTASCDWSRDSASFGDFGTAAACPAITVATSSQDVNTSDNDLPDIVFDELKPGKYHITAEFSGSFQSAVVNSISFRITDGASTGPECGRSFTSGTNGNNIQNFKCSFSTTIVASSAKTFKMQGAENATGSMFIINSSTGNTLAWTVTKAPIQSAEAITLETIGWHLDVNIGGGNANLSTGNVATYTEITDTSWDLVINTGSASAEIPCSTTNPSTGLTCSAGDESLGVVTEIPYAGTYKICASFEMQVATSGTGIVTNTFQFIETPNNAQTILSEGNNRSSQRIEEPSGIASSHSLRNCGVFNFTTAGQKTLRVMYEQSVSGSISSVQVLGDREATVGNRDIHITMFPLTQQFPTPAFTDLTDTLDKKVEGTQDGTALRTFGGAFNCDGTSLILNQTGDAFDSIGNISGRACTITVDSGLCTANNICSASTQSADPLNRDLAVTSGTSSIVVACNLDGGADCTGFNFELVCVCEK